MVRQDLEADSPYADAVVHGDGLISLQFRRVRVGPDDGSQVADQAAGVDQARAQRGRFHAFGRAQGRGFRPAGSVTVALPGRFMPVLWCVHTTRRFGNGRFQATSIQE